MMIKIKKNWLLKNDENKSCHLLPDILCKAFKHTNMMNIRFVVPTKCKTALVGTALCITHAV